MSFTDDPRKPQVARAKLLEKHGEQSSGKWLALSEAYAVNLPKLRGRTRKAIEVHVEQCKLLAAEAARREVSS